MATAKGKIKLRGRFPAGTKVGLHRRVGDGQPSGDPVKTAKVSKDSVLEFDGLDHLSAWYAVAEIDGEQRVVQVTAKDPDQLGDPGLAASRAATSERLQQEARARSKQHEEAVKDDPLAGSPALDGPDPEHQIVTGARSTTSAPRLRNAADPTAESRFSSESAGVPSQAKKDGGEPQPHPRQEDVPDSVPQMSSTLTGEATPVAPGQLTPEIPQSEVPEGTPQRSDTEFGSAAIVPAGEVQPSLKQEDVPDSTKQRSSTELGEAEPIPQGDPIDVKRERDSSAAKARGATEEKPLEQTVKGAAKKKAAKKSSASKKAPAKKKRAPAKRKASKKKRSR